MCGRRCHRSRQSRAITANWLASISTNWNDTCQRSVRPLDFADFTSRDARQQCECVVLDIVKPRPLAAYTMPIGSTTSTAKSTTGGRLLADHQNLPPGASSIRPTTRCMRFYKQRGARADCLSSCRNENNRLVMDYKGRRLLEWQCGFGQAAPRTRIRVDTYAGCASVSERVRRTHPRPPSRFLCRREISTTTHRSSPRIRWRKTAATACWIFR